MNITTSDSSNSPVNVSVILSFYNDENYVKDCLQSLVMQDLSSFEIICLFDKGSTDRTYKELKKFEYEPRIIICEIDHVDRSTARNIGLSRSNGSIVVFCETDALYRPDFLSTIYKTISKGYDMVHPIGDGLNVANNLTSLLEAEIWARNRKMKEGTNTPQSAWAFKRHILEETGGFKQSVEIAEDRELWARASKLGYTTAITPHEVWSHRLTDSWIQFLKRSFRHGRGRQAFIDTYGLSKRDKIRFFFTLFGTLFIPCLIWLLQRFFVSLIIGFTLAFVLFYFLMTIRARYLFKNKLDLRVLVLYPLLMLIRNLFFSYGLLISVVSLYLTRFWRTIRKIN
ncbi:glycosyltransferase family 2 protein [Candidatus Borrarchaeum sp.]|uniref:glycosyltransferase n=1 Tax=Candidatus Borrarchaeum sp. TaxID=2846742 RepID=UPI00257B0187|nr:glycosyltransferase [Candidatus Borrarchaeum sp.]